MSGVVVEDGTGLATANSFVDVSAVDAYMADRGVTTWVNAPAADKAIAIVRAGDYLRHGQRFWWRGLPVAWNQGMPWPRTGVTMFRGLAVPSNVVPQPIKDAQCELCYRALTNKSDPTALQPDLERGGFIEEESVGELVTRYMQNAPPETLYTIVHGFCYNFLVQQNAIGLNPVPYQTDASQLTDANGNSDLDPFAPGEFTYPIQTNPLLSADS